MGYITDVFKGSVQGGVLPCKEHWAPTKPTHFLPPKCSTLGTQIFVEQVSKHYMIFYYIRERGL